MGKKLILLLLLISQHAHLFSQEPWKLTKNTDGIEVYTIKHSSDFKTFKGHITLNESIHSFVAMLNDVKGFLNWGYKLKQVSLLERSGDTLQIYHAIAEVPFPYKDREGVYLNKMKWQPETNTLFVDIEILDDYMSPNKKYTRVTGKGFWEVKVLTSGKLDITFQMQINPGGSIPAWLVNLFIDDTPFYTLQNIQKAIKNEKYHQKTFDFIK